MRWQWIDVLLFLLLIFKGCSQKYNTIWKNDFKKVLFSMMGPEWADLRLKLVTEITLTNQENYQDDVECPEAGFLKLWTTLSHQIWARKVK